MPRRWILILLLILSSNIFSGEISILSYNVENLFDPSYVTEKKDWTFMPKSHPNKEQHCKKKSYGIEHCLNTDWTVEKLNIKLNNLARVINSYPNKPDILALIEIEDHHVVARFANMLGYDNYIITNSPDPRGVNVALLYNETLDLKYVNKKEFDLDLPEHPSRNILLVEFKLSSYPLFVYINHWPSQMQPVTTRIKAANLIKQDVDTKLLEDPKANVLVLGDFNTIDADYPNPLKVLTASDSNSLIDIDTLYRNSKDISLRNKKSLALGTYFYARNMVWDTLDHFFINNNLINKNNLSINTSSYKIITPQFSKKSYLFNEQATSSVYSDDFRYGSIVNNVPINSNFTSQDLLTLGYSDHFPIVIKLIW